MLSFFGIVTSPSSTDSSPTIMRKSVVFPEPFGPTRPTFSPGLSWNDASTNRICLPYCLLMRLNEIMGNRVRRQVYYFTAKTRPTAPAAPRAYIKVDRRTIQEGSDGSGLQQVWPQESTGRGRSREVCALRRV